MISSKDFLLVDGITMGTKVAPTYACVIMANLEQRMLASVKKIPLKYFRYMDDIWFRWDGSPDELQEFIDQCNAFHPTIKFTYESSRDEIIFLDTIVKMNHETGKLYTDLYCKPTDAHNYLPAQSYHPSHCNKSLPYSQILRLKRICTNKDDFAKHTSDMKGYFL